MTTRCRVLALFLALNVSVATVRFGPQTHHEMMQGFFFYTADAEDFNLVIDPKTGQALAR